MSALPGLLLILLAEPDVPQIVPERPVVAAETVAEWTFDDGTESWRAQNDCRLSAAAGSLIVESTGDDPYMHHPVDLPGGQLLVELRARSSSGGSAAVYWTTDRSPSRGEDKSRHFSVQHDGQWHEYRVRLTAPGRLTDLRIDPSGAPGKTEIDWVRLVRQELHPLGIEAVETSARAVRFTVRNHAPEPVVFTAWGEARTVEGDGTLVVERPLQPELPLEAITLEIAVDDLPALERTVFVHHAGAPLDAIARPLGEFSLEVARDGRLARVRRDGQLVAALAPLVHCGGRLPALELVAETPALRFEGDGVALTMGIEGNEIALGIAGPEDCEGPVVRAVGALEQGLFAGLEYLGRGERSSSKLDVETEEHLRFAPDPLKVTLPLMSFVTDRASVAMTWSDMSLQPLYATPNFFDASDDHRMALRGPTIEATVGFDRVPGEETVYWAVAKQGLPPLPPAPRSVDEQWELCLKALNGPLRTEEGWGHCVEERWARHPLADMASTIWRLTGEAPELPRLVPGGSHVRNDAIYFVTGRADEWRRLRAREAADLIARQQPDGSYRYSGKYARGHFENTASGVCARPAALLLEYARLTGDRAALEAGVKTLEYMKRFRTPRGAQVWEVPLHTPDQLASAYLVWAYVRGYELTGDERYVKEARKWALSGIPFVYLWTRYPIMLYATPPVFGATNWVAPCWIGLPVQWVGGVYAYALTMLAPHDDSLDWNHLARGILISAEQQQFPDGPYVGLLPDSIELTRQERRPWRINPCALVSLRLVLDGRLDGLAVADDGTRRVVAPFPVTIRDGKAHVEARRGARYQVLIDGEKVVDVASVGRDVIDLDSHR